MLMSKSFLYLFLAVLVATAVSCNPQTEKNGGKSPDPLVSHIDSTVKPGDDFFLFANGKWFKEHPIPASEQSNGLWQLIQDTINSQVKNICVSASTSAGNPAGSNKQKIGDFFFTGMDSVSLNKTGISPLKSDLGRIDGVKTLQDLAVVAAYIHSVSGSPLCSFEIRQDDRISSKNAVFISQGGLSLPNRDYYFDKDARAVMIRGKFVDHLAGMFKIMGYADAGSKQAASKIMELETALAAGSRKLADTRDPLKNYNKFPVARLKELAPGFDWMRFFESAGLQKVDTVIVGQPEFLTALNSQLKAFPLDVWKNYLKFHLIRGLARYMDDKTYLESFSFYSTTLRGIPEPKPRWKRVVEQTNGSLGELIGQIYVDEYLPTGNRQFHKNRLCRKDQITRLDE